MTRTLFVGKRYTTPAIVFPMFSLCVVSDLHGRTKHLDTEEWTTIR